MVSFKSNVVRLTAATLTLMCAIAMADEPSQSATSQPTTQPAERPGVASLRTEARALTPIVKSAFTKKFLDATADLPRIEDRQAYVNAKSRTYYCQKSYDKLAEAEREGLQPVTFDERIYYMTKYGSPLAYSRVLEVLDKHNIAIKAGQRLLDYGYGTIGHLHLLASNGIDAVGVDVDPLLPQLYCEPSDQGKVRGRDGLDGRVTLVNGQWPGDGPTSKAVGRDFDLIVSKNTLKNGYIHPARPVDKRMLVDLGVGDEAFVAALAKSLKPNGHVIIYNICPAPAPDDKPYIPWADGNCPFPRAMWEEAGFEVIAFDVDDSDATREMGWTLGWGARQNRKEFDADIFAHYSIFRKKA